MSKMIDEKQAKYWGIISGKLEKMSSLIHECELILMLDLKITEGKPFDKIKDIIYAVSGQAYMFMPQSQWTGGNSLEGKNFSETLPHIAKKGW